MTCRHGFTLIEVMVALVLTAIVVGAAYQIFTSAIDVSARVDTAGVAHARATNARRWLSAALGSVDITRDTGGEFAGETARLTFTTWLLTGDGWFEPNRVSIEETGGGVAASGDQGVAILLFPRARLAGIDYLGRLGEDSPWLSGWESAITAPMAVRIRVAHDARIDTLLLRVGERG